MELGHNEETDARSWESLKSQKKCGLFDMIVPVLTLMTIVNCVVILVLVMNIGRKVNGLEQRVQLLQDRAVRVAAQIQESEPADAPAYADVSDIDGNAVDAAEAADIVEAAALEDTHKEDVERTNSSGIRRVYLTFDDGPSANTDRILDILNQYGVKATFSWWAKKDMQTSIDGLSRMDIHWRCIHTVTSTVRSTRRWMRTARI